MVSNKQSGDQAFSKPLQQKRPEVALSAFSFLFSEIVQQMMKQEQAAQNHKALSGESQPDLEQQLFELGVPIGERVLELMFARELTKKLDVSGTGKREIGIVNMLHFIN